MEYSALIFFVIGLIAAFSTNVKPNNKRWVYTTTTIATTAFTAGVICAMLHSNSL